MKNVIWSKKQPIYLWKKYKIKWILKRLKQKNEEAGNTAETYSSVFEISAFL